MPNSVDDNNKQCLLNWCFKNLTCFQYYQCQYNSMCHYQELLEMVTKQRHKRVSAGIGVKNYGI